MSDELELLEKILAASAFAKASADKKNAKGAKNILTRSRGARGVREGIRGLSHLPKADSTLHGTLSALSASPREAKMEVVG